MTDALDIIACQLRAGTPGETLVPVGRERLQDWYGFSLRLTMMRSRLRKPTLDIAMLVTAVEESCARDLKNCGSFLDEFPWIASLLTIFGAARHVEHVPLTAGVSTQTQFVALLHAILESGRK